MCKPREYNHFKRALRNSAHWKKNELNLQIHHEIFFLSPILLSNVFSRSAMQKMANIQLVIHGSLKFEDTFRV